jgi:hypothetical protein
MSQEQRRDQKQTEETSRVEPPPVCPSGTGETKEIQDRLERLAVATQRILEKGVLSSSTQQAEQRLEQNRQQTGE